MIGRTALLFGAALVGASATAVLFPDTAVAAKKKPFIRFVTDHSFILRSNRVKTKRDPRGSYQTAADSLAVAGDLGRVSGRGNSSRSLTRGIGLARTGSDLETRKDFPATFPTTDVSVTETDVNGDPLVGGTAKLRSWVGTDQGSITVKSYR